MILKPLEVKPLDYETVLYLCKNLRQKAREEAFASGWDGDEEKLAETMFRVGKEFGISGSFERPFYCGGPVEVYPGAYQFWSLASDEFGKGMLSVTKYIRRVMLPNIWQRGGWRVEARLIAGDTEVTKWMALLGAKLEKTDEKKGKNGEDFLIYVWSPNDVRR
jgi:hypothetical protein